MLFRKSKYVEVEVHGERQTFLRPHCDAQLEWLSRLSDITDRQKGHQRFTLEAGELRQMREDLAGLLSKVDGQDCTLTADEIGQVASPTEVFAVWAALLQACQLQESDRGKSERQSMSPSTIEVDTTAGRAQIKPNGRDAVLTP